MKVPILFLSDSPDLNTGLARIGRDLAWMLSLKSDEFRVGYLGLGGTGSSKLPFQQYFIPPSQHEDWSMWGLHQIERVWQDFAGAERGIVFTIYDPTRMLWLSQPSYLPDSPTKAFLMSRPFALWGYFPIDATGPNDRLSLVAKETLAGYDRRLAYTAWGAD